MEFYKNPVFFKFCCRYFAGHANNSLTFLENVIYYSALTMH